MALNPNISELDLQQAQKRTIDALDDAVRIVLAESAGIAIQLDAAEDSVQAVAGGSTSSALVDSAATGVLIAAQAAQTHRELQVLVKIISAITGTATLAVEISPVDSGDVWIASGTTVAVTGSTDLVSAKVSHIARRVRVSVTANTISGGSATAYLLSRS
jgi:hypothetical protein